MVSSLEIYRPGITTMKTKRNPNGYWNSIESVERELLAFIKERGIRDRMPTDKELLDAGQTALRHAITKHGGHEVFAKRLGLKHLRRKRGLWNEFPALEQEIRAFVKEHGNMGMMPSAKELRCAKRTDLVRGIAQYGGYPVVASKLGLGYTYSAKPKGYWKDFENVKKEVLAYMKENDTFAKMPTAAELLESGQASLGWAINYHGGYQTVAERLGLKYTQKRQGYWKDVTNIERAVLEFVEKHGTPGQMPSLDELKKVGYGDLSRAISKHGGYTQIANRLKLSPAWKFKPMYYWKNSANLEREILDFVNQHGTLSVMPTEDELESAHRRDLVNAITKHGGFTLIALGLGLIQKRMTPLRAKDVEHTARAIQPLAESNLLSGAQVMVILRRAGLLEYRNPRVLRLSASLARGNHDEIESAISNLVSSGEEIVTETVTVAESDNLTQSEIEALTREGFDTNAPGVQLNVPAIPDTQREQAIIRGLSNLGELRLPLDDILGLLTSKILWQEFYKRLYAWYGSLAAAQTVTAEDVNAAILAAYPEHTANEFVAEASALFTFEVEQAVNFAASLSDSGWCGPRLRLHQADAARRMADVLIGSEHSERSAERESKQAESKDATRQNTFLLNADDPGMGKSASFLAAVAASGVQSVIIVAPKTVADDTWMSARGEIKRCLPHARIVRGIDETLKTDPDTRLAFFVLHYEELLNEDKVAMLAQKSFDCLCLDEIHFIKQRATQVEPTHRRSALELLRASAQTAIGLTGTPLINELAEPMSLLQTLSQHAPQFDHARLSSRRMSDVADVFEAMLPHIIRRRKDETLLHLPGCDVRPVSIPLPLDLEARMIEIYKWQRSRASEALVQLRKLATDAKLAYLVERARAARKMLILTYLTDDISEKIAV
ncbi:MAG: hypothetical protein HZC40_02930 [Chloroflexi bacterium]|nr:hypothetical protein [Chloroflexota bacterium]